MGKKLLRSSDDVMLAGVCAGLAETLDLDPSIVRIVTLVLVFGTGVGLLPYLVLWMILPAEPTRSSRRS